MCKVIDADCVLANMFANGWTIVTSRDLNQLRETVENASDNLFIDVSSNAVCLAIDQRPDIFAWIDDVIQPAPESQSKLTTEYVDKYFNWRIPEACKAAFITACRKQ